jgi:hypothetical protein
MEYRERRFKVGVMSKASRYQYQSTGLHEAINENTAVLIMADVRT